PGEPPAPPPPPPRTGDDACGNGIDDDHNGLVDDGCPCRPGATQMCYPGDAAEVGRGPCAQGTQFCVGTAEFGTWSDCVGAIGPSPDDCGDGVDDDCNGAADDGPTCVCAPGAVRGCY